jgi:probable phosphoglycerate mutase
MTSHAAMKPDLIVVRHAHPEVMPEHLASAWPLSPEGWAAARSLGKRLGALGKLHVVSSPEVKAVQTGEAIRPGAMPATDERFGEQGRGTVPFLSGGDFRERVIAHFRHPDERMLGEESSAEAAARFDAGARDVLSAPGENDGIPVIVSHGRIVSAWLATHAGTPSGTCEPAETIWTSLRMPDALLLRRSGAGWCWSRLSDDPGAGR